MIALLNRLGFFLKPAFKVEASEPFDVEHVPDHIEAIVGFMAAVDAIPEDGYIVYFKAVEDRRAINAHRNPRRVYLKAKKKAKTQKKARRRNNR